MDEATIAWVRTLVRRIHAGGPLPFDFVVEYTADHPDADLAAAWRAPVVAVGSTFTTDYMFDLAYRVDPVATASALREQVTPIFSILATRTTDDVVAVVRDGIAAIGTSVATSAAANVSNMLLASTPYDLDLFLNGLIRLLHGHAGMASYKFCDAYAWLPDTSTKSTRARRGLAFAKQLATELRRRVPAPTWAMLLRDA